MINKELFLSNFLKISFFFHHLNIEQDAPSSCSNTSHPCYLNPNELLFLKEVTEFGEQFLKKRSTISGHKIPDLSLKLLRILHVHVDTDKKKSLDLSIFKKILMFDETWYVSNYNVNQRKSLTL